MTEQRGCRALCLGAGDEPDESHAIVVASVTKPPVRGKEFFRQLEEAFYSQTMVLVGGFNHTSVS